MYKGIHYQHTDIEYHYHIIPYHEKEKALS